MYLTLLFVGYSRRTLNYREIITLFDLIHLITMVDLVVISVERRNIDCGCSLEKEFTESIHMNP